jgi:excisionase family DNA binding protein
MRDEAKRVSGYTPNELARLLRVSADRVRRWITNGELTALNTAPSRCGRPRYVILPHHLAEFERRRAAAALKPAPWRRRRTTEVDYFPDL